MNNNLTFKKISSIKYVKKKQQVYNFSVEKYENYIANGFVVHNCQNYKISQSVNSKTKYYSPKELIDLANEKNVTGISFTFNEPTIYMEYLRDIANETNNFKLAIKTNGFVTETTLVNLNKYHAWNVDIKGDEEEYQKVCGASLHPVLQTISYLVKQKKHVEISYLILPRQIRDFTYHESMRQFFLDQNPHIPIHLLYFFPFYKMAENSYHENELIHVYDFFKEKMPNVYISNLMRNDFLKFRNTYCPECESLLISRNRDIIINNYKCCSYDSKVII